MRSTWVGGAILALAASTALAAPKGIQFWNLTANSITNFQLSPAGKNTWGKNQCLNDSDKSVDHDERLKITDVTSGVFDAKFNDNKGRVCTVRNIAIKANSVFSIEEKQLSDCQTK
jgi:hypothetical protein